MSKYKIWIQLVSLLAALSLLLAACAPATQHPCPHQRPAPRRHCHECPGSHSDERPGGHGYDRSRPHGNQSPGSHCHHCSRDWRRAALEPGRHQRTARPRPAPGRRLAVGGRDQPGL